MTFKLAFACSVLALSLAACLPSENPYYTSEDVLLEPDLSGSWKVGTDRVLMFERVGSGYRLTVTDGGLSTIIATATLFELEGHHFLDIVPEQMETPVVSGLRNVNTLGLHILMHVAELRPGLKLAFGNPEWFAGYLQTNPQALSFENEEPDLPYASATFGYLSGDTAELQRFLLRYVYEEDFFTDYLEATWRGPEE